MYLLFNYADISDIISNSAVIHKSLYVKIMVKRMYYEQRII